MASKFESLIRKYCEANGITIPVGFGRNTPSRFAVVLLETPPKLVATTWFKLADVAYFINGLATPDQPSGVSQALRVLDFKELTELVHSGKSRFTKGSPFHVPE
jgi:hypothetical protein